MASPVGRAVLAAAAAEMVPAVGMLPRRPVLLLHIQGLTVPQPRATQKVRGACQGHQQHQGRKGLKAAWAGRDASGRIRRCPMQPVHALRQGGGSCGGGSSGCTCPITRRCWRLRRLPGRWLVKGAAAAALESVRSDAGALLRE